MTYRKSLLAGVLLAPLGLLVSGAAFAESLPAPAVEKVLKVADNEQNDQGNTESQEGNQDEGNVESNDGAQDEGNVENNEGGNEQAENESGEGGENEADDDGAKLKKKGSGSQENGESGENNN